MPARAVRRRLFRIFMSLPPPILRLLSGGAGVHSAGRTLDPRLQYLNGLDGLGDDAGLPDPDPSVARERLTIDIPTGQAAATALRPLRQDSDLPVLVFAAASGPASHADGCEALCAMIAREARSVVLCVDAAPRSLSPDDAVTRVRAIYDWTRRNGERFGAPADDAAIGGAGLGGAIAARITLELKIQGEPQPALQFLLSPDFTETDFTGVEGAGLAPAVIATTGFDAAADSAEAYARALRSAGVSCHFRRYDSLTEAFVAFTGVVPAAARAAREIASLTAHALQSRYAPSDAAARLMREAVSETPTIVDRREAFN
ncbi:alpha/beta hydrolase [Phenylobacterium immobile]|uniref:alpha/beta hydrolase n=1 Tax=Phenylobacterium immobile TaxID=21 RepID=UPI000A4BF0FA|nr:alpha/beta hydrolase fold domain-containing protein [Phenylobacterium immobile]